MELEPTAIDCMAFAGGFTLGASQAGFRIITKKEPAEFKGFGVPLFERNMPGVAVQVAAPEAWTVPHYADLVLGNPPCSGFSAYSSVVWRADGSSYRGINSPANVWLGHLIRYAARVRPPFVVFESVQGAGKLGLALMRDLWAELRQETGLEYRLTHVFMNAALVGGDVERRRYFWVAHTKPFGIEVPRAEPRTLRELIGDLPELGEMNGHVLPRLKAVDDIGAVAIEAERLGITWRAGQKLFEIVEAIQAHPDGVVPAGWYLPEEVKEQRNSYRRRQERGLERYEPDVKYLRPYAIKDHHMVPKRIAADKVFGVLDSGSMQRLVHPWLPRTLTFRESARIMGLPDSWDLEPAVRAGYQGTTWFGKGIPVASGRWLASWVKKALEGRPGWYTGDPMEPGERIIDVTTPKKARGVFHQQSIWADMEAEEEREWARQVAASTTDPS